MRNLFLLTRNTLKLIFRKKSNILIYLVLPVVVILFIMHVYQSGNEKVNIGIYNKDTSGIMAKDFIKAIEGQDKYKVKIVKGKDVNDFVAKGKVDCVITIPEDFDESIYNQSFNKLQISSIKGEDATAFIQHYVNYYMKNLMDLGKAADGNRDAFNEMYTGFKNQKLKVELSLVKDKSQERTSTVYSIGFLIMFMMQGANTTSSFILREKKDKIYNRIFYAPVNSRIYILANILSNMCLITVQSLLVIYAGKYLFKLDTGVSTIQLLTILLTFGLVCVTLGILCVAFSENTSQTGFISTLIMVPTCMLSGCYWPLELMPKFMQKLANFLPQTWTLRAITQLQNGKSFTGILPDLGIVLIFALNLFLIGIYKMKTNDSVKNFI